MTKSIPDVSAENLKPFDFVVVATKNIPDVKPTVVDIISPAITPNHTVIVLVQNGLNIELPLLAAFPNNAVLSGVSLIGVTELSHGVVRHDDHDILKIGAYDNPNIPKEQSTAAAKAFVEIYNACGVVDCQYDEDVNFTRWRKLLYNSSFNSVGTILRMDTPRMRMFQHVTDNLIKPAMKEIQAIADKKGIKLEDEVIEMLIRVDPIDTEFKPSMCQDIEKVSSLKATILLE